MRNKVPTLILGPRILLSVNRLGNGRMDLNEKQNRYLQKRQATLKAWKYAGPLMLIGVIGFVIYLFTAVPLLINPFEILSRLESGTLGISSMEVIAVILPIMSLLVCFLLLVIIALMHSAISNEKRYLDIIEILRRARSDLPG